MTQQFYQLTLSEAIALHKCGLIQAPALLYFFLRTRLAPGWKMTLHQQEISQHLGISRTAFYKAIQKLKQYCSVKPFLAVMTNEISRVSDSFSFLNRAVLEA